MTIEPAEQDVRDGFSGITFNVPISRIVAGAHRRRTRKRLAFGAVPALGLVAAGGAALLNVDRISATNVACFNSADPKAMPFGASSPAPTGQRPEELCAEEWRDGYLPGVVADRPGGKDPEKSLPVPPLTACVVDEESIGVFPTDDPDFCTTGPVARRMNLAELPDGYDEHIETYVDLREAAAERVREAAVAAGGSDKRACLDAAGATRVTKDLLAEYHLADWAIRVEHTKSDAPCWTHINFENDEKQVVVYSTDLGVENIWINDSAAFPNG